MQKLPCGCEYDKLDTLMMGLTYCPRCGTVFYSPNLKITVVVCDDCQTGILGNCIDPNYCKNHKYIWYLDDKQLKKL